MNVQEQFERVVRSPLNALSANELKPVALAFWHENYLPALDNLENIELQRSGYLIDLFAAFNCVEDARHEKLMQLLDEIKKELADRLEEIHRLSEHFSDDEIAQEWGLAEDANEAVHDLLPYQTRHYAHA